MLMNIRNTTILVMVILSSLNCKPQFQSGAKNTKKVKKFPFPLLLMKINYAHSTISLLLLMFSPFLALAQNTFCDTIPFQYINGKMVVSVQINNQNRRFIFDTGAPLLISDDLQQEMKNRVTGKASVKDVAGNIVEEQTILIPSFKLGNIPFERSKAVVYQKQKTGLLKCFNFDGIIGSSILENCIVHIDLSKKRIVITDRIENIPLTNPFQTKMKLDGSKRPFINIEIGQGANIDALFDSGSDKFFPLSMDGYLEIKKASATSILNEGFGSISSGLYGGGQAAKVYRVMINQLNFGKVSIKNVITTASDLKNKNAIGMGLAAYGTITLDYIHKTFYFSPTSTDQTFSNPNFWGFIPLLLNGQYVAGIVYQDSPAEKLGMKTGNKLLKINQYEIADGPSPTLCELFLSNTLTLPEITVTFLNDVGEVKTIKLKPPF